MISKAKLSSENFSSILRVIRDLILEKENLMAGKYTPLYKYLKNLDPNRREITISFEKIEAIIHDELPFSARNYRPWWANEQDGKHVNAHAWMNAGWKVDSVDMSRELVRMVRK